MGDALTPPPAPTLSDEELMELAASAPVPSSDEMASMAAAAATALPLAGTHGAQLPDAMGDEHVSVATAPAVPHRARRLRIKSWGIRLATLLVTLALFAGGLALGALAFDRSQPPAPTVGDLSTGGVAAPRRRQGARGRPGHEQLRFAPLRGERRPVPAARRRDPELEHAGSDVGADPRDHAGRATVRRPRSSSPAARRRVTRWSSTSSST